ncbi:MAG TPA: arginyltransferase [Kiloniellaceae bacterium]|nr:arginyltransferase [Kiloniellaceae bacterium]
MDSAFYGPRTAIRQFDLQGDAYLKRVIEPQKLRAFHVLPETPCPYLEGLWERKLLTQLSAQDAADRYDALSQAGFRRSHNFAYRPACRQCNACIAVRVPVAAFRPSDSLKRVMRRNADLTGSFAEARGSAEHYDLFTRYIEARHGDGEMADMTYDDYLGMIEESGLDTRLAVFRDGDGQLQAACLLDRLGDGASAVYSYFTPKAAQRSLGTYMVLWLIQTLREQRLPYLYLGYWIASSRKMAYKVRFRPVELLTAEGWKRYGPGEGPQETP